MQTEINVNIKQKYAERLRQGYPLISKEALVNEKQLQQEGAVIRLMDEKNRFIAKGYYGRQNKGYGWLLTRNENEQIDQGFFNEKLKKAHQSREAFYEDKDTTAFRLFNGEGDGIGGLIIDYYDGYYVVSWYSKGIYQFKDYILAALTHTVEVKAVYQKKRFDTKGQYIDEDDFVMGTEPAFPLIIKENGVNFAVYLNDGAMVGVFLDQREVRKTIRDRYAEGKTVLNMFSYTGAFSVFAALGGAEKTTSVDLANRSLTKTIEQFSVNDIDHEAHDIIVEDVFKYFKYAIRKQLKFDLVILDPPSFAKSKKFTFSAAKDYKNLLRDAVQITEDQGVIVASTNSSAFDMKRFKTFIDMAFKESHINYKIIEEFSLPEDFKTIDEYKEGNYLKVVFIKKLKN